MLHSPTITALATWKRGEETLHCTERCRERNAVCCFPVLRDVRVADELVRAEEPLALEALHAPRLRVDGRLGQQDADAPPEALVLHLQNDATVLTKLEMERERKSVQEKGFNSLCNLWLLPTRINPLGLCLWHSRTLKENGDALALKPAREARGGFRSSSPAHKRSASLFVMRPHCGTADGSVQLSTLSSALKKYRSCRRQMHKS